MSYGMEIKTTTGLQDISIIKTAKHMGSVTFTSGTSGSATINVDYQEAVQTTDSGAEVSYNICYIKANDGKDPPKFTFDDATKLFTWSPADPLDVNRCSSNFRCIFVRMD